MTKKEAYERLELPEGADLQEVRRKFAEMYNDYRMHIDNAHTQQTRLSAERRLEELKEAYALLNESDGMDDSGDLPRTGQTGSFEESADAIGRGSDGKESGTDIDHALAVFGLSPMQPLESIKDAIDRHLADLGKQRDAVSLPEVKEGYQNAIRKAEIAKSVLIPWLATRGAGEVQQNAQRMPEAVALATNDVKPLDTRTRKPIVWYGVFGMVVVAVFWYFMLRSKSGDDAVVADTSGGASKDSAAWQIAVAANQASAYEQYLKQYPAGVFHVVAADSMAQANKVEGEAAKPEVATRRQTQQAPATNTNWRKRYDEVDSFYEGLARVELDNKYGYVDKQGNEVISLKYDYMGYFSEGLAFVRLNGKYGFVDEQGNEVIPLKYDFADSYYEGVACVGLNGKRGYIDKQGNEITPLKYDDVWHFQDGEGEVMLNGKHGRVDKKGNVFVPIKYDDVYGFHEGLASVKLNGKYGFVDRQGNEVIPLKYTSAGSFSDGVAWVGLNGKTFKINKQGECVGDCPE